jgi:hypothetical protein
VELFLQLIGVACLVLAILGGAGLFAIGLGIMGESKDAKRNRQGH